MATGDITPVWNAATALTATALQGLASSSTLLGVWESAALDNDGLLDRRITAEIKVGAASVTAGVIRMYLVAQLHDVGGTPAWPAPFDGTESAETVASVEVHAAICKPAAVVDVVATNGLTYNLDCPSAKAIFAGTLPRRMVVVIAHNTTAALDNAGSTNKVWEQGSYENVEGGGGGSGSVTSVDVVAPEQMLDSTGGPITSTGSITLSPRAVNAIGNITGATTYDWNNGWIMRATLTGNVTFTLSNPINGMVYKMFLTQDGTGSRTITWPANVKIPGTSGAPGAPGTTLHNQSASTLTEITLTWNGTDYICFFNKTGS